MTNQPFCYEKQKRFLLSFSHPDYTVGFGISPNQPQKYIIISVGHGLVSDGHITVGWESHPTPKDNYIGYILNHLVRYHNNKVLTIG
jgi:hypothetical protein